MRILVTDDDFASRRILQKLLAAYGEVDVVTEGSACIEAFRVSIEEGDPYRLVFLDIVMPGMSGHEALREIRALESDWKVRPQNEARVVMTSVLEDPHNVIKAYNEGWATSYLVKPISQKKLEEELSRLGFSLPGHSR